MKTKKQNSRKLWTKADIATLRRDYPDTPSAALARRMGRSIKSIYSQAAIHGIAKSADYLASRAAGRIQKGDRLYKDTCLKTGHTPHNKGVIGWQAGGNASKTRFKIGNKPKNWLPIGSERWTKDGYLQRKVSATGYQQHDWICVHILIWQQHHGAVPAGHLVIFINGNKKDIRINNLELITQAENMRRNTIHNLHPEIKQIVCLRGLLNRIINKEQKNERQPEQH